MTAKRKLIYVSAGAGLGALVSGLALIHEPSLHLLALGGIVLGAVVVFDWLLILTLPHIKSDKRFRKIFALFTLPTPFIAFGLVALAYHKTFYYGLISFIVGVILSRSLRKMIFEASSKKKQISH
jgi:energy-converting hydrogenase Eha subunit A